MQPMPGNAWVNANHIFLPVIYEDAPDLVDQCVKAIEKVWAQRGKLPSA